MAANPGEVTNLYSVTYNTNNSTGGVTPATQTAESSSGTYTFKAPMGEDLVRTGYGFAGWSESASATTVQYKPGATITLSTASPTKTLYAVWARNIQNITNMTELTPLGCSASSENETKQLKDTRDNKTYWVTKLKDGNCWMTQNLALNLNGRTLTPSDSDVASNWSGASGVSSGLWSDTGVNVIKWYASGTGSGHASYGNHYSWEAATAGTGSKVTTNGANASSSICPKGWKLPTSKVTTSGSFGGLTAAYGINNDAAGSTALRAAPSYFVYGGFVLSGNLNNAGNSGYYWSSTALNSTYAYILYFGSSSVTPSNSNARYYGQSVRCLVQGS